MLELQKFVGWLSYHPPAEYVARSIVVEYLADAEVLVCQISQLRPDDSLQVLSSFGPGSEEQGHIQSGLAWRRWCQENLAVADGHKVGSWSKDGTQLVLPLRDRGGLQGFIHFIFGHQISGSMQEALLTKTSIFASALSLYFSLTPIFGSAPSAWKDQKEVKSSSQGQGPVDPTALTARQLRILSAMVEAKTNHEIADELGFSISTVRQETMKIYKVLGVMDRRAAAQRAMELNLS
jgi:DNA-binding CsgD family transcriptional regulator